MSTIILIDADGNAVRDSLTGRLVEEEVSSAIAEYLQDSDRYIASQHDNDQRYFRLIHLDTRAWDNMRGLASRFSAEDDCLGVPEEVAAAEHAHYLTRFTRCRRALRLLCEACTPTQWRRFVLNKYCGKSTREIGKMEGCHHRAIWKSIVAVEKKIKKNF